LSPGEGGTEIRVGAPMRRMHLIIICAYRILAGLKISRVNDGHQHGDHLDDVDLWMKIAAALALPPDAVSH
jgi:hypothetical protein